MKKLIGQTTDAIEAFANFGCIATGILQIIALNFDHTIWRKYAGWLRTVTSTAPSEEIVKSVVQHEYYHNFRFFSRWRRDALKLQTVKLCMPKNRKGGKMARKTCCLLFTSIYLILFLIVCPQPLLAILTGKITDATTGNNIEGAIITTILEGGNVTTTTNAEGNYSLNLPGGGYYLTITADNYRDIRGYWRFKNLEISPYTLFRNILSA